MTALNPIALRFDQYSAALVRLKEWGIRVHPRSRLTLYEEQLKDHLSAAPSTWFTPKNARLAFVLREIDDLCDIVAGFSEDPDETARERLALLPGGVLGPDDDAHSEARNAQYELLLWAHLRRGGFDVRFGNPDLCIRIKSQEFWLEAKRPRRGRGIDENVRKAVGQIEARGIGAIALSLDLVMREPDQIFVAPRFDSFSLEVAREGVRVLERHRPRIWNRVVESAIVGVIVTGRVVGLARDSGLPTLGAFVHREQLREPSDPSYEVFEQIADSLASSL